MPYQTRHTRGATWGEHLYVIAAPAAGLVKVGRSWDPQRRCRDIGHACPWLHVELAAVFPEAGQFEAECLRFIEAELQRVGREWFRGTAGEAITRISYILDASLCA